MTPDYVLASLIVVLIPGTGVLYTLAVGVARGPVASLWAALGCTAGILPALGAALLGLSAILHAGALAYMVLKYAGAAYLLYLAWQTWRDRGPLSLNRDTPVHGPAIARTGALINVLNPKLSVFFLAFLPQFIDAAAPAAPQIAALGAVFMALTLTVFILYGLAASAAGAQLRRPAVATAIRRGAAAAFAGLGLRLALPDR